MMDDLIRRKDAVSRISDLLVLELKYERLPTYNEVYHAINDIPSAQPERKTGRWEMLQIPINPLIYKCSECGSHALEVQTGCLVNRHYEAKLTDFCPNCGAKMLKEGEG